jgi:ATP-dependent Clp protease ATP-binding subunit ClpA
MELSLREALQIGHHYIGTEHLLLGLLRGDEGVAAQVLAALGAGHARVQERVLDLLGRIEQDRLGQLAIPGDLVDVAEELARVRQQKESAFDAGDLGRAAALRDREKVLLTDKLRLERQLGSGVDVHGVIAENRRMQAKSTGCGPCSASTASSQAAPPGRPEIRAGPDRCPHPGRRAALSYLVKYQNSGVSQNWVWLANEACVPDSVFFHTAT